MGYVNVGHTLQPPIHPENTRNSVFSAIILTVHYVETRVRTLFLSQFCSEEHMAVFLSVRVRHMHIVIYVDLETRQTIHNAKFGCGEEDSL